MSNVIVSKKEKGGVFHEVWCPYVKRIKKGNRKEIPEAMAINRSYCECRFCRSVRGIVYKYRTQENLDVYYDDVDDALCLKTKIGFWKLVWYENIQKWHLFHMNRKGYMSFEPNLPPKKLMRGSYHGQTDFMPTGSVKKAIDYIISHDKNYKTLEEGGLRQLPKNTPKQKLHYRQARNKRRKESIRNVFKIFRELERSEK